MHSTFDKSEVLNVFALDILNIDPVRSSLFTHDLIEVMRAYVDYAFRFSSDAFVLKYHHYDSSVDKPTTVFSTTSLVVIYTDLNLPVSYSLYIQISNKGVYFIECLSISFVSFKMNILTYTVGSDLNLFYEMIFQTIFKLRFMRTIIALLCFSK